MPTTGANRLKRRPWIDTHPGSPNTPAPPNVSLGYTSFIPLKHQARLLPMDEVNYCETTERGLRHDGDDCGAGLGPTQGHQLVGCLRDRARGSDSGDRDRAPGRTGTRCWRGPADRHRDRDGCAAVSVRRGTRCGHATPHRRIAVLYDRGVRTDTPWH